MTIIAYDNSTLYADSRSYIDLNGSSTYGTMKKIVISAKGDIAVAIAGPKPPTVLVEKLFQSLREFIVSTKSSEDFKLPENLNERLKETAQGWEKLNSRVIFLTNSNAYVIHEDVFIELEDTYALGTGAVVFMALHSFYKDPVKAIEGVCRRVATCGGTIQSIRQNSLKPFSEESL